MKVYEVHVTPKRGHQGEHVFVVQLSTEEARDCRTWLRDLKEDGIVGRYSFKEFSPKDRVELAQFLKYIDTRP
jgi:hypothetical protein